MDDVEKLTRWCDSGGGWQVVSRASDRIGIALLTCDGGQEMERFTSTDPRLIAFVGDRRSSED